MKTAIQTWFHHINYGTALQVFALSTVLKNHGHDAYIINYTNDNRPATLRTDILPIYCLKRLLARKENKMAEPACIPARDKLFSDFYAENLKFTSKCTTLSDFHRLNGEFDCFICGSDQIWAPSCYDPRYYLDFVHDTKRTVAYAPSVGLKSIDNSDIESSVKKLASRIEHISTREKSGSDMISALIGKPVNTVLDPTLLLSADEWRNLCAHTRSASEKPYLLAYFLKYNKKHLDSARKTAERLGLEFKLIPVLQNDISLDGCITEPIGPKEFTSLIDNASFICTDSFHGIAFSINFNKQFMAFERFSANDKLNQNSRIYNILGLCKLENRIFNGSNGDTVASEIIDFADVNERISRSRSDSLSFLNNSLSAVEKHCTNSDLSQKNLIDTELCCGCGACSAVCPANAISIAETDGFFRANTDADRCISCGACVKVCPFIGEHAGKELKNAELYSFKHPSKQVLKASSSGGAAHSLSTALIKEQYSVAGCVYNPEHKRAEHEVITPDRADLLPRFQGSKYMQSDFSAALKYIKEHDIPVIIFGTPCQITGAKSILGSRDNVLYVDLICHGVPSYRTLDKYLDFLSNSHGLDPVKTNVICRYKEKGWKPIYLYASDGNKEYCRVQHKDPYFLLFESGFCYSKACYECRWRNSSNADLRLGDFWGKKFSSDNDGVSMVLSFTPSGDGLIGKLSSHGDVSKQSIDDYYSVQQFENVPEPTFYTRMANDLSNPLLSVKTVAEKYAGAYSREMNLRKFVLKIKNAVKHNGK